MMAHAKRPSIWNIPYQRNLFFTGREEILLQLHHSLHVDSSVALTQPQGISGLGGVGKTQTALEYIYRYHSDYKAIFWIRADSYTALTSEFISIAQLLHLPEAVEGANHYLIIDAVMRWLRAQTQWLLVFDNIDDLSIASSFIPSAGSGHILLTTRAHALGEIAQTIEIQKMQPEIGALFLLRRSNILPLHADFDRSSSKDRLQATELSQALDGLPLALDQAGAYIKEIGCSLTEYSDLYRTRQSDLLKIRPVTDDYPESVATTWSLSFEQIAQTNQLAAALLDFCSFLSPDSIAEEIITGGAAELGPILQYAANPLEIDNAIKELRRFSLMHRESEAQTLSIHRLVQAIIKGKMNESIQRIWAERMIRAMNSIIPRQEADNPSFWKRCLSQVPPCAGLIEQFHIKFPEASNVLNGAGGYLSLHGRLLEAEDFLTRALTLRTDFWGPNHIDSAQSLSLLADIYLEQGNAARAETIYRQVLTIREQVFGYEDPQVAYTLTDLGFVSSDQGKIAQAETFHQRARVIREQALGAEHPDVALSLEALATLYRQRGKYDQAESLYQQALTINSGNPHRDYPHMAKCFKGLASLYDTQMKYIEAEHYFLKALSAEEHALGIEHPHLIWTLCGLASIYRNVGKYEQAELLYQRALAIHSHLIKVESPHLFSILYNQALLHMLEKNYRQAEKLYLQAEEVGNHLFGPDHPELVPLFEKYAHLLHLLNRDIEAIKFERRAQDIVHRHDGELP